MQSILTSTERLLSRWKKFLPRIDSFEDELIALNDYDLRKHSLGLRYRIRSGEPQNSVLPEAFATVREAGRRVLGMRHYSVQMLGGMAMSNNCIVEMQTGEGKTLTATLPLYLAALNAKGAHLATVNDYLAERDAKWMEPLYKALGLSVGIIQGQMPQADRSKSYAADITYGTANEMGFDFLRDRLLLRRLAEGQGDMFGEMLGAISSETNEKPVQRELHFMLVDEADSILIDEARTPLIISSLPGEDEEIAKEAYGWAADSCKQFLEDEHFEYIHDERRVELSLAGRRLTREIPKPTAMNRVPLSTIYEYLEQSIKVEREMIRDRHYVIRDDEIVIVDEFTGRLAEGRKWRAGIHQAVEAKEDVEITFPTSQAARITVQDFFLRYQRLSGMTGTGVSSGREMKKIYKLPVVPIPTNRPPIREQLQTVVYAGSTEKWDAIAEEINEVRKTKRPILVGTRSIDKSEELSKRLEALGIQHTILNARHVAKEAEIVAAAGEQDCVTVATNMAGRGTDIKLGEGVYDLGGLHVICTELHESKRIDRQLIGRCGRQGDPGTYRQYLSLDDEILESGFNPKKARHIRESAKIKVTGNESLIQVFYNAQKKIERRHFRDRKSLLYQEKERKKVQFQMGQDPYLDTPG